MTTMGTWICVRVADVDRRQAGRGRGRPDLRQHQPRDRRGHRPGRRRVARRHGARDRRGPPGVRRDDVVDRPRVPQGVPAAAEGSARQAQGRAAPADRRRGRHADRAHVRDPAGHLHRGHAVGHRPDRPLRVGVRARQPRVLRDELEPARRSASRSVSSARSRRGTSRSCSTCRRSRPRSPRVAPWC